MARATGGGRNGSVTRMSTPGTSRSARPRAGAAPGQDTAWPDHPSGAVASTDDLAAHLTARSDSEVAELLQARRDLISPPSSSFTALAARAGGRPSVEVALADMGSVPLAVAQAVVSLGTQEPAAVASATGIGTDDVGAALGRLRRLALVVEAGPVVGLAESFGPRPEVPQAPVAPRAEDLETQDAAAVADQASRAAEEIVRLVTVLLEEWGREGGAILRTGGVGVRVLSRTAQALDLTPEATATVIELAAGAGLLGLDEDGASWVPSAQAAAWRAAGLPERWAPLVLAWATSARTPWLVGTREDDGTLRPVLGEDVEAGWARALRARVLALMASLPIGTVLTPTWVRQALTYARPRRVVPEGAVTAVLAEAEVLGLTGGGTPSDAAARLARGLREAGTAVDEEPQVRDRVLGELEEALAADLSTPVDVLLVQSDLTAIVPGRPEPVLGELLERSSVVESRGGALTVRFTPQSVRGALDVGMSAEELTAALERYSPSPLPSALTVLVQDAARHHGAVRVREVASVLRVADPAAAAGLVADARLAELELDELAPGVLTSSAPAGQVLRLIRSTGGAPVLEDAHGALLLATSQAPSRRGGQAPEAARPGAGGPVRRRRPSARDLAVLVGRMRAGEQARTDSGLGRGAATDPVHALALLRQARASRSRLRLRLAGQDGSVQERRVRVLAVEPGRVRLADVVRETELTVAVHRIVGVEEE